MDRRVTLKRDANRKELISKTRVTQVAGIKEDSPRWSSTDGPRRSGNLSRRRPLLIFLLLALFATATLVRMYGLGNPPSEFWPSRQYYSAWGARYMYYQSLQSAPSLEKSICQDMASIRLGNSLLSAPLPTIESAGFVLYRLTGAERMWLPRAFSALSYVFGGLALYFLARKLVKKEAALLAVAFYLLLPYAVVASRSFQSEPLMVASMICSLYAIVWQSEKPTLRRAAAAGIVAAIALLVRPVCAFMIFGAFVGLAISRQGLRKSVIDHSSWVFAILAVLPTLALLAIDRFYLSAGGAEYVQDYVLRPGMLLNVSFYWGWLMRVCTILGSGFPVLPLNFLLGFLLLLAAVVGMFMHTKPARALIAGLGCGYLMFGLTFTWHASTHDYFHLQMVPLAALSLGPPLAWVMQRALAMEPRRIMRIVVAILSVGTILWNVLLGLALEATPNAEDAVDNAVQIGDLVKHSRSTITLSQSYGFDVTYYGWFATRAWPTAADLEPQPEPARGGDLFRTSYQIYSPEYFVVADLSDFEKQADLKAFLYREFSVLAETEDYLIFDLQHYAADN